MRYEDASHTGAFQGQGPIANDDTDQLAAGSKSSATGNLITGEGTQTGSVGADVATGGHITAIAGKGGEDSSFAGGKLSVLGEYGKLSVDADGNYVYQANKGVENVRDRFTYTLADNNGASDTASLVFEIGKTPLAIKADAQQIVVGPDGVVTLPAGVELSDIHVVGRNLVVDMPDGTQLIILDGAIFVPQLVLGGVEVPSTNVAALLIGQEVAPAAGENVPSSGGNFAVPPPPLDPGIPLGDLIPPTEYDYIPPEPQDVFEEEDSEPEAGLAFAQLDDDAQPGGNPLSNTGDDPGGSVANGSLPGSGGDGTLTWDLLASGTLPAGFSFSPQLNGDVWVMQGATHVLTISVDSSDGDYTVTQVAAIDHPAGGNENNLIFVIEYSVTDEDGDVAIGSLSIDVDDDMPTVTVQAGPDAEVILTTDDADTIGVDSDTDATTANFSGVFAGTSVAFGADGAGPGSSSTYALAITGSNSGLTSHGATINLYLVAGVVVGSTAANAGAITDGNKIFTVSTTNTGEVTLTQFQQIDHTNTDPTPTGDPYADHIISMADGLVTLTRAETAVDGDGDEVTGSATVNIGANLHFTDDGPTVDGARADSSVTLDETNGAEPVSSGAPIVVTSNDPMIVGLGVDYGADGQGPAPLYGLSLLGGVNSIASGLATALGDHPITLNLTSSTLITATYQDGGTHTAFTIQMNANGTVTVTQFTALEHLIDGPPGPAHDDALSLVIDVNEQLQSLVNATVTYQDFDGDKASASAPIGQAIVFKDDGPTVSITAGSDQNVQLITDDEGTEGGGSTNDSTTANFQGVFSIGSSNGGGDGTASAGVLSYSLATVGGASGLSSHGNAINLYMVGTTVVGAIGSQPADLNDADIVFTVSVDANGVVTLVQRQQIDHLDESPAATGAPFNDQSASIAIDNLITLTASASITDNDGDTASDSETVNIASNLVFRDDGPSVTITPAIEPILTVDETDLPDGIGPVSFIDSFGIDFGADGPAGSNSKLFSLSVTEGPSGLVDTLTGNNVFLFLEGGQVVGREGTSALDAASGEIVFTVSVDATNGDVTLDQLRSVVHGDPGDPDEADTPALLSADDLIKLNVDVEDFDGDTATASINIARNLHFEDDGPSIERNGEPLPSLVTDDTDTPNSTDGPVSLAGLFSGDFGNDGPKDTDHNGEDADATKFSLSLKNGNGTDSGLNDVLTGDNILLRVTASGDIEGYLQNNTSVVAFTIDLDPNAGTVSLEQDRAITHDDPLDPIEDGADAESMAADLIVVTATITDGDGDTDTATANIGSIFHFEDDGPSADNDGNLATVDDSATALNIGNISTLLTGDSYGKDGPAAVGAITIGGGNQGGSITIDGSGNLLYTAAADASGGNVVETFTYTIKDGDGDTANATFTVTLTDSGATVGTTSIAVDEEGLANGIANTVYGDGSDLAGTNFSQSGTLTGLNFGSDGPGNIVLAASPDTGLRTLSNHVVATVWDGATHTLTGFDDANGNGAKDGGEASVFTLQITNVSTGAYTYTQLLPVKHDTADTEDNENFSVQVTVTDSEGDGSTGSINILIDDDSPQLSGISGGASVTLDETSGAEPVSSGAPIVASTLTAVITATKAFGADGPAAVGDTVYGLSLAGGVNSLASGLQTAVGDLAITLQLTSSTLITGTYNGGANTAFTIQMNTDGTITVTQYTALEHLVDGPPGPAHDDSLDLVLDGGALTNLVNATITIKDGDGDTHSGSTPIGDQIIFKDDGPSVDVTATNEGNVVLTTQDADTIAGATDSDASTANFSGVFARTFNVGGDGAAAPVITYDLSVLSSVSGLASNGVAINLYELANGVIIGSTALSAPALETDASVVFSVTVAADGTVTLKQYQQVDHTVETSPVPGTGSPFDDQLAILANNKIQLTGSSTITDNDGDTATDSVSIDLGGNIRFADDGPDVAAVLTGTQIRIDETDGIAAAGGEVDPAVGGNLGTVTMTLASLVTITNPHVSADAPTTNVYSLVLSSQGVNSGLLVSTTNDPIFLYDMGGGVIAGSTSVNFAGVNPGNTAFQFSINSGTGAVTLTQFDAVEHGNTSNFDEDSTGIAAGALNLRVVATDFDGDTDSAQVDLGSVVRFEDDGPALSFGPHNPVTTKTATGTMTLNVGSDDWTPATLVDTFINVTANGGTVGTTPVALQSFVMGAVTANTSSLVTYGFSFTYDNDPVAAGVQLANGTGSITINKGTGQYSVTIDQAVGYTSTVQTGNLPDEAFVTYEDEDFDNFSQEEVTVAELTPTFFVQFSGLHNGFAYGPNGPNGTFSGTPSYVSASNDSNGVASDTIAQNDVLNLNFYTQDPGGDTTAPGDPKAFAEGFFLEIDHWGGEDMVIVLRLADPANPGTVITRTFIAEAGDFYDIGTGSPAGYNFTFDQDDAVLVVEANDYRFPGDPANLSIVGIQLVSSTQGTTGSGYNLDGTTGGTGGIDTLVPVAFSAATDDNDVFKIVNIGFKLTTATPQPVTLNFNVTAQDSDGDVTANVPLSVTFPASVMPVAMDLDGDGVEFLDSGAGAAYAYDGVNAVETAWVGPDDGILVRDSNGNGTVDGASEFVFGHDGLTDLQALAAQYGSTLDASDADFANFGVWQDANSNGVVDAGEFASLTARGITSINLVSDGVSYSAAGGDVQVAGSSTYSKADGSTGLVADASFATGPRASDDRALNTSTSNIALAAAVAAAGLAGSQAAAQPADSDDSAGHEAASGDLSGAATAVASSGDADASRSALSNESMVAANDSAPDSSSHSSAEPAESGHSLDDSASAPAAESNDNSGSNNEAPSSAEAAAAPTAPAVAMVSAEALQAAGLTGEAESDAAVGQVVAEVLAQGNAPAVVDAVLNAIHGGDGGDAALANLASPAGNGVPAWDMAVHGAFSSGADMMMKMGAEMLHHDAVQPAQNG